MKANPLTQAGLGFVLTLCLLLGQTQAPVGGHLVQAQDEVWTTHTNGNYVNDLAIEGDYLWAATEGGVVHWDTRDGTYVKYTTSDGLADNDVHAVAVDLDGSKWFGTSYAGVCHFDGTTWTTYTTSNSGLASNYVTAIAIDDDGSRWFGTSYDGVSHFDGTTWTTYDESNSGLSDGDIEAIAIDGDGSKWFGTYGGGVSHFDGTTWTTYTTSNSGLASNYVTAIAIDDDGNRWFGTSYDGVSHFDGTTWTTYDESSSGLSDDDIEAIAIDGDGSKWFGTYGGGASHFDGTTWTTYTTSNSDLASNYVEVIAIDSNGNKWFGVDRYGGGIDRFDGSIWTHFATTDGLVDNTVHAISAERFGGTWFGTDGGASWQGADVWISYTTSNSRLKHNHINAIAVDNDSTVWFGTGSGYGFPPPSDGGVSHFDGATWTTYNESDTGLAGSDVLAIAIDVDGSKWFGTNRGVSHFDGTHWTTYNTANSGLASNYVKAIAIDNDGGKWLGTGNFFCTGNRGVSHFDGVTWTTYDTYNSALPGGDVQAIAIDLDGSKWFGTCAMLGGGVSHFDGTAWKTYTTANSGLASNSVRAIAIDSNGGKWFGTSNGASHFDGATWMTYDTSNSGLTDNSVYAIAVDNNGSKWFGTYSGLSRLGLSPETETYVRVVDMDENPLPGAWVYRNGSLISDANGLAYPTNFIGILSVNGLDPSDRLVVLAPRHKEPTARAAHGPLGQSWAFWSNVSNIHLDDQGNITTTQTCDPASGEHLLTIARDNVLVTFNLIVSIEWDATITYTNQISHAVQYASDYLYDLTDSQMAFGRVDIYDNGVHWADADIQISTKNVVHPHAYVGGITSEDTSHVIRVGRGWDGNSGNQGAWDQPDGYRTLAHEFGHYALYLYDEYFAYTLNQNGNLTGEMPAYCTGPENRNPATDATNASVMDYQYTSSELSARGVLGLWSELCEQTAQWQLNGESDWETITRMYTDTTSPPRWQLTTPADRGSVMAGPDGLRDDVLALPTVTISNTGASGPPRLLTVYDPEGDPYPGAVVALYKQEGQVVGEGFTDSHGRLEIYGADEGDILRVASFNGGLAGSVTVGTEINLTLTLAPVGGLASQAVGGIPHMRVIAEPSQDPGQIDLLVFLQGFGPGADPSVIITEPGSDAGHVATMNYSPATDTYEGEINFSATRRGMGRIRTVGSVGSSLVRLQSTYRLQRVLSSQSHDVFSDDGNLSLHLDSGSLPGNEAYLVVMPPGAVPGPLPEGLVLLGDPYDVTASGALATMEKPAVLRLHYDRVLVNSSAVPEGLGIYRWDPNSETWQNVPGSLDEEQKTMVASVTTLGTYALLAQPQQNVIFLPLILKCVL